MARTKKIFKKGLLPNSGAAKATTVTKVEVGADYADDYDSFEKDLANQDDSDDDDYDYDKEKDRENRGQEEEEEEKEPAYMLFDFRRGPTEWPLNVEYVDPKRAEELLEKATTAAAEEAAKSQKKEGDEESKKGGENKKSSYSSYSSYSTYNMDDTPEKLKKFEPPPESCFEVMKDGSYALIVKPGHRLKLVLSEILEGGDADREEREKEEEKIKKLYAKYNLKYRDWKSGKKDSKSTDKDDDWADSKWFKEYVNEYTITIDMKLSEPAPREGIALFQTALIHADENKRTGAFKNFIL